MRLLASFSAPARALIIAAAITIVLLFLQAAEFVFAPVLLAVFIAVITEPQLRWTQRKGVPKWIALALVAFVLLDVGSIIALVATGALEGFRDTLRRKPGSLGVGNNRFDVPAQPFDDQPFYVADEMRAVSIQRQTEAETFWDEVQREIAGTTSRSVVVFVHGYNYGFERHCKAAVQLQRALLRKAIVLMFSWPSNGRPTDYIPDQADVEWSVPLLARLLADLGDRLGPRHVHRSLPTVWDRAA